jgi:hypothetical protein
MASAAARRQDGGNAKGYHRIFLNDPFANHLELMEKK